MEGEQPFPALVAKAIEDRRRSIHEEDLPRLKELFRVYHASLQGLHQLLIRKGLVQQDPYKSEQKISDITMPPDDPYLESERELTIGVRLDAYDNILEFLNNYFEFRLDALGFRELRKLSDLARYINWSQLTSHSQQPTTRGVADLIGRARGGQDSFASGIISDALGQLARTLEAIQSQIKAITAFKREEYKQVLREQVLPSIPNAAGLNPEDGEALEEVRSRYRSMNLPDPFIPDLAAETLAEMYGEQADARRKEVLDRLRAAKPGNRKKRAGESLHDLLISSIRSLSAASRPLDTISTNLQTNADAAESRAHGLGQRLREWIDRLTNRRPARTTYQVEYTDESTGTRHSESVVFDDFIERTTRKARLYGAFLARAGGPWEKLRAASDEQLYRFIEKELGECHLIHRRAGAIDEHLKSTAAPAERKRMKGVKIELSALRNAIVKANQLKHEYIAKKGEIEQMKKLGVDP